MLKCECFFFFNFNIQFYQFDTLFDFPNDVINLLCFEKFNLNVVETIVDKIMY